MEVLLLQYQNKNIQKLSILPDSIDKIIGSLLGG